MRLTRRTPPDSTADLLVEVVEPKALPAEAELERLYADYYERLFPRGMDHARRFLGHEDAKDAVQATMAEMWYNWRRLRPEQRSDQYFFGALRHHVRHGQKAAGVLVSLEDAESELAQFSVRLSSAPTRWSEPGDVIDLAVAEMAPRRREAFLLYHEEGFTYKEVAATLRVSEGSVNTHLYKAMAQLRATFVREGFRIKGDDRARLTPGSAPQSPAGSPTDAGEAAHD